MSDRKTRVALVTGGGSGIGNECVKDLASAGAEVVVADLREVDSPQRGVSSVRCDVADPAAIKSVVRDIEATWGRLDIAVNSAGVGVPSRRPLAEISDDEWRRVMDVNIDGVFYSMRAEIPLMMATGGGSIVNIASVMGVVSTTGAAAYTASKHALLGLTKAAALDYASTNIRVNVVAPAFVDTPLLGRYSSEARVRTEQAHPLGRIGTASEIAAVVGFLVSERASFVTGACWLADGGYTAL